MLNRFIGMGRLTADPELRTTQTGTPVTTFTLAIDRDFGQDKQTDFVSCVAWKHTAEFVSKYFGKGQLTVVSGRLQSRKWTDRDNKTRTEWEVQCDNVYFAESKREKPVDVNIEEVEDDGQLPF